ncbi:hypothetical protein K5D44_13590 [Pseudomonas cichorii]|nr:hypothetical protein [Pseudomonas cichorii]MBX8565727.1 hypothetical protein [Pseudomonas cichorii]
MPTEDEMLIAKERTQLFADLLAEYLKSTFRYKNPCVTLGLSPCTVDAKTKKYDLYFRVTPLSATGWDSNTLVVARIGFAERRKGHGKNLMEFLVKVSASIPYTYIGLEQTNTSATAFGIKFGLKQHGEGQNFLASVDKVKTHLM